MFCGKKGTEILRFWNRTKMVSFISKEYTIKQDIDKLLNNAAENQKCNFA